MYDDRFYNAIVAASRWLRWIYAVCTIVGVGGITISNPSAEAIALVVGGIIGMATCFWITKED